jgi:hypothetical protein
MTKAAWVRVAAPWAAVVAAATLLHRLVTWNQPYGLTDEGFLHLVSAAVARGDGLYERFDMLYGPGLYQWHGLWMVLFGDGVFGFRMGVAILGGVVCAVLVAMIRPHVGWPVALGAAAAVALTATGNPVTFGWIVAMASAVCTLSGAAPSRRDVLLVGVAAGLLVVWREDAAALLGGVAFAAVLRRRRPFELFTLVAPAFTAGVVFWVLVLMPSGDAWPMLDHVFRRVLFLFQRFSVPHVEHASGWFDGPVRTPREVAMRLFPILGMVPPTVYVVLLIRAVVRAWRDRVWPSPSAVAAAVALPLTAYYLWERPDIWHLRTHLPLFVAVVGLAAGEFGSRWRPWVAGMLAALGVTGGVGLALQHRAARAVAYPTPAAAEYDILVEGGVPPWAGRLDGTSDVFVVLPWGPGWYMAEGVAPPTRVLNAHPRAVAFAGGPGALVEDLIRPEVRAVISFGRTPRSGLTIPDEVTRALHRHYEVRDGWEGWWWWDRLDDSGP